MLEREVKLGAGPGFRLPDLSGVVKGAVAAPSETLHLETVYYDTPDLRLARWGVSLRWRAGEGWTVKLAPPPARGGRPSVALERDELTFEGGSGRPPEQALSVVRAYVRKAHIGPVTRLSTVRRRVRLTDSSGTRIAEVVDDEVSVRDGRRVATRFREIEVETPAVNGSDGVLAPLVTALRRAGAGAPDPTPKYVRALGAHAHEPPEVWPQPVEPDAPAADVIRSALADPIASLFRHDPRIRAGRDPEAVHQARVATRKLRSNLRTFASLLDPEWSEPLRSELGWLATGLGAVRDREVLLERLRARSAGLPAEDVRAATALLQRLGSEIEALRGGLKADLDSDRYVDLLDRLVQASHSPATLPEAAGRASELLPALASTPWRRLRSAVRRLPKSPTDPELHRIRILAKRARYAAEAVAAVAGPQAGAFAQAAARLQTVLGDHQDAVTAQAWLQALRVRGRRATAAAELIDLERIDAEAARARWPKAWAALDRKALRDWM